MTNKKKKEEKGAPGNILIIVGIIIFFAPAFSLQGMGYSWILGAAIILAGLFTRGSSKEND